MGYKLKYRASEINTLLDVVKNDVMDKNLVEKSQLTQSDASEWDDTKLSYIKNRTHYEEARTFTAPFEFVLPHGVVGGVTIIYEGQETSVDIGYEVRLSSATGGIISIIYGETGVISVTESEPSITEDSPITVKYCKPLDEKFLPSSVATKDDIIKTYKTDFTVFDLINFADGAIESIAISKEFYEAVLRKDIIVVGTGGSQGGIIASTECSVMEDYTRIRFSLLFNGIYIDAICDVDNVSMEGNVDVVNHTSLQKALVDGENFSTINGQSLLRGGNIDINSSYVLPFTLSDILTAADKGGVVRVESDFVQAAYNKKPIIIPIGKSVTDGWYSAAYRVNSEHPDKNVRIDLYVIDNVSNHRIITFTAKSTAPATANVSTKLTNSLTGIYSGDSIAAAITNTEFTVNSIDWASFTNNGKTTAMTPNTVYNFVNNGVNRTIAVYDDHRLVITSESNVPLSPAVTYTSQARIKPSVLPSSLVTKPELRETIQDNQADWSAVEGDAGYIKNRTHYYRIHQSFSGYIERFLLTVGDSIQSLGDYKLLFNDKFYEFDESIPDGSTITFGAGENQQAVFTFLGKSTSGKITYYDYILESVNGVTPDSNGHVLHIVTKGKTLDPIYLPELRGDWEEMDANSTTFINNKTHSAPVYYPFIIGDRISLIEDKDKHTIDNYRVRYDGELYALPNELGSEVYIPSADDWKFKVAYELYNEDDNKSIYSLGSYVNPDITLENASVEVITDIPGLGGKKLDEFYISKDIARVDDIEKLGFTKNKGTVTAVVVNNEKKTPDSDGVIDVGEIKTDKADFATDLTGVVEATPEMFTYRPSAGDKSVRDESAVIRRIKGNTSVWRQYAKNPIFADGTANWSSNGATLSANPNGGVNFVMTSSSSQSISQVLTDAIPKGHKVLIVIDYKRNTTTSLDVLFYLRKSNGGFDQARIFSVADSNRRVDSVIITTTDAISTTSASLIVYPMMNGAQELTAIIYSINIFDLTDIFGAGNEPTTYEEFRKYYPDEYYPYCPPEVRPMRATGIETIGFNAFNGEYAEIIGGQTYYLGGTINTAHFATEIGGELEEITIPENRLYTPSENGYIYATGSDICINLSHSGVRNGEYKPYEKNTLLLPEIAKYFPNGMHGIGDECDEINGEMAIQRIGVVDIGSLKWTYSISSNWFYAYIYDAKRILWDKKTPAVMLPYTPVVQMSESTPNMSFVLNSQNHSYNMLIIRNTNYSDANSFTDAMQGVLLYYQLSKPIYTPIDEPLQLDYKVDDFGTEKMLNDTPSAPFKADIVYQFNAEGRIRDNSRNIERLEEQLQRTKEEFDSAIATAITTTLNTPV